MARGERSHETGSHMILRRTLCTSYIRLHFSVLRAPCSLFLSSFPLFSWGNIRYRILPIRSRGVPLIRCLSLNGDSLTRFDGHGRSAPLPPFPRGTGDDGWDWSAERKIHFCWYNSQDMAYSVAITTSAGKIHVQVSFSLGYSQSEIEIKSV